MIDSAPPGVDGTHDPALRSWIASATPGQSQFPIQNLPFGVFTRNDGGGPRIGIRIGDDILDPVAVGRNWLDVSDVTWAALETATLNGVMALPVPERRALRSRTSALLREGGETEGARRAAAEPALVPVDDARMRMPASVGTFVDFYACLNHAVTAGSVLRRGEPAPLLPNWKWMPLGYHGRASSLQVGGTPVLRPMGQRRPSRSEHPVFGPTQELDYEVEIGAFVGPGSAQGHRVTMADAAGHVAGYVLVNDWSARDLQTWEGGPLGPFQSKSFASSVSPWVVTSEALAPFRAASFIRSDEDPEPLPHLDHPMDRAWGGLDVHLEAYVSTKQMRAAGQAAQRISRGNAKELYWTMQQMLAHMASNGSGLTPGDLLASGTISGDTDGTRGCLLEATQRGRTPIQVGDEMRGFLEDEDEVTLTAHCEREGYVPIGFGKCSGVIVPANA